MSVSKYFCLRLCKFTKVFFQHQNYMNRPESIYSDEFFMKRCLDLAGNGLENVAPNPMVGAVVVHDGMAIGEGFHRIFGGPHAEVNAINAVREEQLLNESTLYVNLEPCAHSGKTPPCSDLIIEKKIPRVVIGTTDSNSLVAGKGIKKLKAAGVEVKIGVLESECNELNRRFFLFHEKRRPYIILKWAQTKDGFIDIERLPDTKIGVNWISNSISQSLVHKWRAQEQAIMVGKNTVLLDDPRLTVRLWKGRNPLRILLDRKLTVPEKAKLLDGTVPTLVFNEKEQAVKDEVHYIKLNEKPDQFTQIFNDLYDRNILSVIVEGGKQVIEQLIKLEFWDEARVFIGDKEFGAGLSAPRIQMEAFSSEFILNDLLMIYRNS